jgi:hypothetical protein
MSLSDLLALARRHILAVIAVLLFFLGIAYDFESTQPAFKQTAIIAFEAPNIHKGTYVISQITTCQILVLELSGAQGQQQLRHVGINGEFTIAVVNSSNADEPILRHPYLTVSAIGQSAAAARSAFTAGMGVLAEDMKSLQARFQLPAAAQISALTLSNGTPVEQVGSKSRAYAALIFLALAATYVIARMIDNRVIRLRRGAHST